MYPLDDLLDVIQSILLLHESVYVAVVPVVHQQVEVYSHPSWNKKERRKITLGLLPVLLSFLETGFRFLYPFLFLMSFTTIFII
jgi:hypothetical protein